MKTIALVFALAASAPAFAQVAVSPPSVGVTPPSVAVTPPAVSVTPPDAAVKADAFLAIDADKNGSLSFTEVRMKESTVTQADFDKYDADKSKSLSKVEFSAWLATKAEAKSPTAG